MQQSADITNYLISQFIGLVILAIVMILLILLMLKIANKLTNFLETQTGKLSDTNEQILDVKKDLTSLLNKIEKIGEENLKLSKKTTSIQQELSLLSSDYSDNQQITHAIELARKGSSKNEIIRKTGLSAEDADAIVRFHGNDVSG